ncbi:MAG: hypothetical protein M3552_17495 [Planctomycetota bacterium]|nr:hypothetical protein [Planctomycetaceae bacterium]MDQ3332414.1 hypothetical protein [Planctomycetota bacterium]
MTDDAAEPVEDDALVTVARFRSAAEAGYFADELEAAESIRPVLTSVDDFNAMSGFWGAVFHLRVPPAEAKRAAETLRELLAASPDEDDEIPPSSDVPDADSVATQTSWLPIALAFAAGSALLFAVQRLDRGAAAPRQPARVPNQLLDKLAESREPWVQALPNGGRRELRVQRSGEFILREDRDADGKFERSRSFSTAPQP